jgi:hypothetical protein
MVGACSTYGKFEKFYKILVGKHEGKRSLGRLRSGREDNNRMDLTKVGDNNVD